MITDLCRRRPVNMIGNLEEIKPFCKLLVRQLRHRMTDFGTRLTKGILVSCPPCVEAGKADWVYLIKYLSTFFGFVNTFLMRHRGKIGFNTKKILPDLIFYWKLSEKLS